ncbi:glucosamine-6-phosphate deaminase [Stieleria varia]|uniref:Glucosamine-6-phosphate deaminase n=1 Tax=Stieleria varia TaxID=2528005 RepID=A0A5C6A2A8_9BACT|nr:glucosamine-6-phosphate deaminase [Stieleria varia]TWT93992.1 Glucosamine-6-phosphate deaminase 1 [Stieleria varia]
MSSSLQSKTQRFSPNVIVVGDSSSVSRRTAEMIASCLRSHPNCVLGLATGGTPVGTYDELTRMHLADGLDFSQVTSFNLDEYIGLSAEHPQSFRYFMQENLFSRVNFCREKTHVPNGVSSDVERECRDYEAMIARSGGIDLQLLGIGHNGHIAFNEPGSSLQSRTRQVALTEETIQNNARFFESIDDVPNTAITMGIGTIMEAKRILLIAFGEGKAEAIERMVAGEPTLDHPASLLQFHSDVTVIIDSAAGAKLSEV